MTLLHVAATGDVYETINAGRELVLTSFEKVSLLSVVRLAPNLASSKSREQSRASMKQLAPDLEALAIAIESGSLEMSVARTIMNTLSIVSRKTYVQKAFDGVPPAAKWLAPHLRSPRLTADSLITLVAQARLDLRAGAG